MKSVLKLANALTENLKIIPGGTQNEITDRMVTSVDTVQQINGNADGMRGCVSPMMAVYMIKKNGTTHVRMDSPATAGNFSGSCYLGQSERLSIKHYHKFVEFTFVLDGTLQLWINGVRKSFSTGDVCLMEEGVEHAEFINDQNFAVVYLALTNEYFMEVIQPQTGESRIEKYLRGVILERKQRYQYAQFRPDGNAAQTMAALHAVLQELADPSEAAEEVLREQNTMLFKHLFSEYKLHLSNAEKAEYRAKFFEELKGYIAEHYKTVNIRDLVEAYHYNEYYFNRLIREYTGMSFTEFVQEERMTQAAKLLRTTDAPVYAIASSVGYNNMGYFYKLFSGKYGMMPKEYRETDTPLVL